MSRVPADTVALDMPAYSYLYCKQNRTSKSHPALHYYRRFRFTEKLSHSRLTEHTILCSILLTISYYNIHTDNNTYSYEHPPY